MSETSNSEHSEDGPAPGPARPLAPGRAAAEAHEPHRLAYCLYDLAAAFHGLWNKGKEDPSLRNVGLQEVTMDGDEVTLLFGKRSAVDQLGDLTRPRPSSSP